MRLGINSSWPHGPPPSFRDLSLSRLPHARRPPRTPPPLPAAATAPTRRPLRKCPPPSFHPYALRSRGRINDPNTLHTCSCYTFGVPIKLWRDLCANSLKHLLLAIDLACMPNLGNWCPSLPLTLIQRSKFQDCVISISF